MMGRSDYLVALILAGTPVVVAAQMSPLMGFGDTRIQAIEYRNDQVVRLRATPGFQVTVELASDERIESIALGDSSAWQVTPNRAGNVLFVKPLQVSAPTNMTIITDVRTYNFELSGESEAAGDLPYAIRFRYPSSSVNMPMAGAGVGPSSIAGEYDLGGNRNLFPIAISDDGVRTYIEWASDGPLPAIYSRDELRSEVLVNGHMRGKYFVIDGVSRELIFRVDNRRAHAKRVAVAVAEQRK